VISVAWETPRVSLFNAWAAEKFTLTLLTICVVAF